MDDLLSLVNLLMPYQSRAERRYERELTVMCDKDLVQLQQEVKSVRVGSGGGAALLGCAAPQALTHQRHGQLQNRFKKIQSFYGAHCKASGTIPKQEEAVLTGALSQQYVSGVDCILDRLPIHD